MKSLLMWIFTNFIIEKLNKSLKKDKYSWLEKYTPIFEELNKTCKNFLEIVKDREITEQEASKFIDELALSFERIIKGL